MVVLGDSFPPDFLRQQVVRRLVPGVVIKLLEEMDDGKTHEKRYVVLQVDTSSTCCVINSNIGPFIRARPALLKCQVAMPASDHAFMNHNSFVDCNRTKVFHTHRVVCDLMERTDWILGDISSDLKTEIIGALKFSPTLSYVTVSRLCDSLAKGKRISTGGGLKHDPHKAKPPGCYQHQGGFKNSSPSE